MKKLWEKIEDFFVGLWDEVVEWVKKPWTKLKNWVLKTALPSLYKNWMLIVNFLVLLVAYKGFDVDTQPGYSTVIGLWLFVLIGYFLFWKFFGAEEAFKKRRAKRK